MRKPPPDFTLDDGRIALGGCGMARLAAARLHWAHPLGHRRLRPAPPPRLQDELSHIAQHLLDDLTAGACSLARLACSCKCWHTSFSARPQRSSVLLRSAALPDNLVLEQLAVLGAVAASALTLRSCVRPGGHRVLHQGRRAVGPGSSLDRLEQFAALMRRHPRATCRVDAPRWALARSGSLWQRGAPCGDGRARDAGRAARGSRGLLGRTG